MILLRDRQKIIENNFSEKNISYRDVVTAEKIFNQIESCDYVILRYKVLYEKEGNRVEDVYRADISAKKLPDTILVKIDNTEGEVEITDEIERELANPIIFTDWDEALSWFEESCKENISAEKIPEDVRKKIDGAQGEVEITDEIERELAARVNSAVAD